jgi:hypothetical protein
VETELDKHYDATNYEAMLDTYGERSPTMTEITFSKKPLGMSFSKNHNGCFIVQSVSAQSKERHVKVILLLPSPLLYSHTPSPT